MDIVKDKLKNLELISNGEYNQGGRIYRKNNLLFKLINDPYFFQEEVIRNIDLQIDKPIPSTPVIYDKIYIDNNFSGYVMEYLCDTITYKEAINKDIPLDKKVNSIIDTYRVIKYLHNQNICVGDIHLDNILISSLGNGYLIDLDYLIMPGDNFKFSELYLVKLNNKSNKITINSPYTDNIKLMLCSISLFYNINLEEYINKNTHDINLETVYIDVIKKINNKYLNKYFIYLMRGDNVKYFDDYLLENLYKNKRRNVKVLKK